MTAGSPLAPLRGVPVTVVGGWLGAGKTTLINGWLRQAPRPDWAVLVNDLGALAIDADRLRFHQGRVLELSGGCLCCSLRDGLGEALLALARLPRPPGHVVIETSGVAVPERIAAQVALQGLRLERLLLVVDLERIETLWHDPWVGEVVRRQFQGVDWLQLSKVDRLDAATATRRQHWLRDRLDEMARDAGPAMASEPRLARADHWRQDRPLRRQDLRRWAEGLGPEVWRVKGEVWLQEHPEGPVRLDGWGGERSLAGASAGGGAGREGALGPRLELAEEASGPWSSSLGPRGRMVVISRAGAEAPRWPVLLERS
jgi:G3E family GTPase